MNFWRNFEWNFGATEKNGPKIVIFDPKIKISSPFQTTNLWSEFQTWFSNSMMLKSYLACFKDSKKPPHMEAGSAKKLRFPSAPCIATGVLSKNTVHFWTPCIANCVWFDSITTTTIIQTTYETESEQTTSGRPIRKRKKRNYNDDFYYDFDQETVSESPKINSTNSDVCTPKNRGKPTNVKKTKCKICNKIVNDGKFRD